MHNIQVSDNVAHLLKEITECEHISSVDFIEKLVSSYITEVEKQDELQEFLNPYQRDMSEFVFNREQANERCTSHKS